MPRATPEMREDALYGLNELVQMLISKDPRLDPAAVVAAIQPLLPPAEPARALSVEEVLQADLAGILANQKLMRRLDWSDPVGQPHMRAWWIAIGPTDQTIWRRFYNLDGQGKSSVGEVALLVGLSESTVRSRIFDIGYRMTRGRHSNFPGLYDATLKALSACGISSPEDLTPAAQDGRLSYLSPGPRDKLNNWLKLQGYPPL